MLPSYPLGVASIPHDRLREAQLYFVCDARSSERDLDRLLEAALAGGADLIQLRDKEADERALVGAAAHFREAADRHRAIFILNDRPELAAEVGADGVHLGQDDPSIAAAREAVGPDAVVGLSTHRIDQLEAAHSPDPALRPDYLSVGPVWETPTKPGRPAAGLDYLRAAAERSRIPCFAIGSIDPGNLDQVLDAGAERVVVVRAIRDAAEPREVAAELRARIQRRIGTPA